MPVCRASCIQCMHAGKARKMGGMTSGRCLLSCPCQAEPEAWGGWLKVQLTQKMASWCWKSAWARAERNVGREAAERVKPLAAVVVVVVVVVVVAAIAGGSGGGGVALVAVARRRESQQPVGLHQVRRC